MRAVWNMGSRRGSFVFLFFARARVRVRAKTTYVTFNAAEIRKREETSESARVVRIYFATICEAINSRHRIDEKRKVGTSLRIRERKRRKKWGLRLNVVEEINGAAVYIKAWTALLRINDINKINLGIPGAIYHPGKMPRALVPSRPH